MSRNATNKLLQQARRSKNDEFYTQLIDIERELQHYAGQFRGKTVYCNCDDPQTSNFRRYFMQHFERLGLRRLIVSCYREGAHDLFSPQPAERAYYIEYTDAHDVSGAEVRHYFRGDGDFRSPECIALLSQADIVVTNPPFSLFREYVAQLISYRRQFLIIGNINAITYKEIFSLIQANEAWLGVNMGRGISGFIVPDSYELYGTEARINERGERIIASNNCLWLTNLETPRRHEFIPLTKRYAGNEAAYPKYDNFDAINIDKTQNIPADYEGCMGVPITFLHKFNPQQFEIVRFRKGDDGKDLCISGRCPYFRILIRRQRPA